jgi:signal transduction histidine kinase
MGETPDQHGRRRATALPSGLATVKGAGITAAVNTDHRRLPMAPGPCVVPAHMGPLDPMTVRNSMVLAASLAAGFTAVVVLVPDARFAYRSPSLQVAVEVTAAVTALVAAQLVYGRFRRSLERRDVLLSAALLVLAVTNLCFSAVPAIAGGRPNDFATWAPVGGRLLGAALLTAAAFMSADRVRFPRRAERTWIGGCMGVLVLNGLLAVALGDALPAALPPGISPEDSARPLIVGHPAVVGLQVVNMLLYGAAAVGFARRAEQRCDTMLHWFAVAAVVGAFARVNYFLFPSVYSEWFYAGDILRLLFFLGVFAGALTEIARTQRAAAATAVLDERRRLARDLHDGMAQDLAFIVQFGRAIARRPNAPRGIEQIVGAAERALDDSRHAIAALVRPSDEPFDVALERTAREAASREGADVRTALADVALPQRTSEALLRVAREAVANAARHGHARTIRLELLDQPELVLRVIDDGEGFDVDAAASAPGRRGLAGMRERVDAVGGELAIRSSPGSGSVVEVKLP